MRTASRLRAVLDSILAGRSAASGRQSEANEAPANIASAFGDWRLGLLVLWLALSFLLGGSSRGDILSLLVLRPLSVLVLAAALWGLTAEQLRENRLLLALTAAWPALPASQLIPLPPFIWQALPGRDLIADLDHAAGLGDIWRPLSMAPGATWNSFWALLGPAAAIALAIQLDRRGHIRLLAALLVLGFTSAAVGIVQMLGDAQGPLYFYRHTHLGLPVGLMANRNHQALLLVTMLPMLFGYVKLSALRRGGAARVARPAWLPALAGTAIVAPLVLITGSRTGTVLCLVGLATVPLLLSIGDRPPADGKRPFGFILLAGLLALLSTAILLGRAPALDRMTGLAPSQDMRLLALPTVFHMIATYSPWGMGFGAFEQVFRIHEPDSLLGPIYMNRVHDDWLEIVLEGGLPAIGLLLLGLFGVVARSITLVRGRHDSQARIFGWLGLALILLFGLASITDYPLRVPSLACLGALALVWLRLPDGAA